MKKKLLYFTVLKHRLSTAVKQSNNGVVVSVKLPSCSFSSAASSLCWQLQHTFVSSHQQNPNIYFVSFCHQRSFLAHHPLVFIMKIGLWSFPHSFCNTSASLCSTLLACKQQFYPKLKILKQILLGVDVFSLPGCDFYRVFQLQFLLLVTCILFLCMSAALCFCC